MIRSMTAYDRKERQGEWGKLVWELRSVNHRFLDVYPRLPEDLRFLEPAVRERLGRRLGRGKVECGLKFFPAAGAVPDIEVNWPHAERVLTACAALAQHMSASAPLNPLVMQETAPDLEPVAEAALELLDEAVDGFVEAREREGAQLAQVVRDRAEKVGQLAEQVRTRRDIVNAQVREKLMARVAELDANVDPGRLEQELVIIAPRLDVDEELERLATHVAEVLRVLERQEPVGRRLDFLMQELNREANTLSSKSADAETTAAAVEMKVLIEQMREQIQNIE